MLKYKVTQRFFAGPLKRSIPAGAYFYEYEEQSKIVLTDAPDSSNPSNTLLTKFNYDDDDVVGWFKSLVHVHHVAYIVFIQELPESALDLTGPDGILEASDVHNDSAVTGVTVKDALEHLATGALVIVDILANRPAFGVQGRAFWATDTQQLFIDTGTAWDLASGGGAGFVLNRDLDYFEGDNPPFMADADVYHFYDSADFVASEDHDVIFKLASQLANMDANGATIFLVYFMSTAESSKNIVLKFDYVVHDKNEAYNGGSVYSSQYTISTPNTANLTTVNTVAIPAARITSNTVEIECRLTRLGTNVSDTHTGDFIIRQLLVTN